MKPAVKKSSKKVAKKSAPKKVAKKAEKKVVKKETKKPAKKAASGSVTKIEGEKKSLTVEQIIKLQKSGKRIYRQTPPHYICLPERMAAMTDKKKVLDVIIRKD